MTQRKTEECKEYFPHLQPYPQQKKVIESMFKALNHQKIALIEAPPGSGKTISVLAPSLIFNPNGKIFWVGSSHRVYENLNSELILINQEKSKELLLSSFIGKKNMCLMDFAEKKTTTDEFYDNCSAAIKYDKCPFHNSMYNWNEDTASYDVKGGASSRLKRLVRIFKEGKIFNKMEQKNWAKYIIDEAKASKLFCPYYAMIEMGKVANVIAWDYNYIFTQIRPRMFANLEISDNFPKTLIVDEADVFYARFREKLTYEITDLMLERLRRQTQVLRDSTENPDLIETYMDYLDFITTFENHIHEYVSQVRIGGEKKVTKSSLIEFFETKRKSMTIVTQIKRVSEIIKEVYSEKTRSSRVGDFLSQWLQADEENFLRLISRRRGKTKRRMFSIKIIPLDIRNVPFYYTGSTPIYFEDILKEFNHIVFVSASLRPQIFKTRLGLENVEICEITEYHIPKENFEILIYPNINSLKDEREYNIPLYAKLIRDLSKWSDEKVYVITTGTPMLKGISNIFKRKFKTRIQNIEWTYCYGRESRGVDRRECKVALVAGFPLPKWDLVTTERKAYLEKKYGEEKGETIFITDVIIETVQNITRILRKPEDRAFIILADKRFSYRRNLALFPSYYQEKIRIISTLEELEDLCRSFFGHF